MLCRTRSVPAWLPGDTRGLTQSSVLSPQSSWEGETSRDAAASSQLATTAVGSSLQAGTRGKRVTGIRGFARRLSKTRLAPVALAVIVVLVLAALLAPVIAPYSPDKPDFALVHGVVLFVSLAFLFSNFAVDLVYAYLDPRIRYS